MMYPLWNEFQKLKDLRWIELSQRLDNDSPYWVAFQRAQWNWAS